MSLLVLLIVLLVIAAVAWLVNTKIPGSATIKLIINIVLVVVAVILVLQAFGVWSEVKSIEVPKI